MTTVLSIEPIRELAHEILERKINEAKIKGILIQSKNYSSIQELILYLKYDVRFYVLSSDIQIGELWDYVRSDEAKLDFVMEYYTELVFRLKDVDYHYLETQLIKSYTQYTLKGEMDEDTYHRLPSRKELEQWIKANPWLIVLYLIALLPMSEGVINGDG